MNPFQSHGCVAFFLLKLAHKLANVMHIRTERPSDISAICIITREAFKGHPHSNQSEHLIIDALRRDKALSISLVAEKDGQLCGHIAFSPVTIAGRQVGWHGLGPISVRPGLQKQGIGTSLVRQGLA